MGGLGTGFAEHRTDVQSFALLGTVASTAERGKQWRLSTGEHSWPWVGHS